NCIVPAREAGRPPSGRERTAASAAGQLIEPRSEADLVEPSVLISAQIPDRQVRPELVGKLIEAPDELRIPLRPLLQKPLQEHGRNVGIEGVFKKFGHPQHTAALPFRL